MASVSARTEYALTSAATTATPTFAQTTGDLVVIFVARPSAVSISSLSNGFNVLSPGPARVQVIYKILDGTEGGSVNVNYGASAKAAAIAYNIQAHDPVNPPAVSLLATGTSVNPNPGTATPSGGAKDYLWIAGFAQAGEEADDDTWCTAAPTDFTNLVQKTSGVAGTAGTNCSLACAERSLNAASLDPGTFTTAQSLAWGAITVAVYPYVVYEPAYALKKAFSLVQKRVQRFLPIISDYGFPAQPEQPANPPQPHFFINPVRRYHKTGRYQ